MKISVLMAVWAKENPAYLEESLESLSRQTLRPSEVVLVEDGPLTQGLRQVINRRKKTGKLGLRSVPLARQSGTGPALRAGLLKCRHELVAHADSDDLFPPGRLKSQSDYFHLHPDLSAVGGNIVEFEDDKDNPQGIREVPAHQDQIRSTVKFRNPMNHTTVMYRKSHVLASGGYRDYLFFEDYDLWCRMLSQDRRFANLPETLGYVRFNENSLRRRRGLGYLRQEWMLLGNMRLLGLINRVEWGILCLAKTSVRLLPLAVLKSFYRNFMRKNSRPSLF